MDENEHVIRIDAPTGVDPLVIAQAVMGPSWLVKAEVREKESLSKHLAMREATQAFCDLYERMLKQTLAECMEVLQRAPLSKGPITPKPLVSREQLHRIAKLIQDMHSSIVIAGISPTLVPKEEVKRLIARGIIPKEALTLIDDAFTYGQLLAELRTIEQVKAAKRFSFREFEKRVKSKPFKTTPSEGAAMALARKSAATYVTGLGNKISDDFATMAIEADRKLAAKYRKTIRDAVTENIERRKTVRELASDIGHKTGDWARDLRRIAATEKERAMQEGQRERLVARHGDPDTILVSKIPDPDACKHCIALHLTAGAGSKPRIFKLSQLESNGTNVGKKTAEWKATVGPVHPWCACTLVHVPEGWAYNDEGVLVPDRVRKSSTLIHDLRKALSYGDSVPEHGVTVRVGDPALVALIDEVIARTPPALFNKRTGVTLITTDHPNGDTHLNETDLAYWTGNEIRIAQNLPHEKAKRVIEHELGHALNVYLLHKFGGTKFVREWHEKLARIAQSEGFVSEYASTNPIECAAEVTRMYLYDGEHLRTKYPRQYTFVHRDYADLFTEERTQEAFGLTAESKIDFATADDVWARFDAAANRHGMSIEYLPNGARIYTLGSGPCLAILSGLHGEERAGPIALIQWMENTEAGMLILEGSSLWLCPLFVGKAWDRVERGPGGVDFNDVWIPGAEGRDESVKLVEKSLRAAKPHTFLDLHEDGHGAKLPYVYGYVKDRDFAPKLAEALAVRVKPWKGSDKSAIGSSETFARGLGCSRTATVETPTTESLAARVAFHMDAVQWCAAQIEEEA